MAVKIPLVLVLWEHKKFGGTKRVFVADDHNLTSDTPLPSADFNDKSSAIGVHPGPDFDPNESLTISLFSDADFKGSELVVEAGVYPNLADINFNDSISSVRFNAPGARQPGLYVRGALEAGIRPTGPAAAIAPIPAVVQLYATHNYREGGWGSPSFHSFHVATLVETSLDVGAEYGGQFSGSAVQVKVAEGSGPAGIVHLFRETSPDTPQGHIQGGGHIDLLPKPLSIDPTAVAGAYDLAAYGFAKLTKAVTIQNRAGGK